MREVGSISDDAPAFPHAEAAQAWMRKLAG
jgi:hypothetical protein